MVKKLNSQQNNYTDYNPLISDRFRGYFPVVIDVETGGLVSKTDALLEIAAITIDCDVNGIYRPVDQIHFHVEPFHLSNLDPKSLELNGINPFSPFRFAISEKDMLEKLFEFISFAQKKAKCKKSVLVGHNAWFDLSFVNAAISRTDIKHNPLHQFTCLDTASLGAFFYGHTVLSELLKRAEIEFDAKSHHSALYDASKTADLFCNMLNKVNAANIYTVIE